jgi:hypothetical protein
MWLPLIPNLVEIIAASAKSAADYTTRAISVAKVAVSFPNMFATSTKTTVPTSPQRDIEESIALLRIFADSIDNAYLDKLARENDIEDYLAKTRKYAFEII